MGPIRRRCVMASKDLDAVLESDTGDHLRQLIFAHQPAPGFCGRHDELEHHQPGGGRGQRSLRAYRAMPDCGKYTFDRVCRAQMDPVLGRPVIECQQRPLVLAEALHGFRVARPVSFLEQIDGDLGLGACRGEIDLAQGRLHPRLHGHRDLVEHVGGLVQPAALMVCARKEFIERLPEAQCPVPDGNPGRDGQAPLLDLNEKLAPALGALTHAGLEADQFFLAFRRGADQHQDALGVILHPGLQVDAIGPDIDVVTGREIPGLPALVLGLPFAGEAGNHRGREVRRVLAEQCGERLLEVASREPTQVQDRQQCIQAPGAARPFRQDRRGKADAILIARGAAVADLDPADGHRADASLDGPFRPMAVPDQAFAAVRQLQIAPAGEIGLGLDLNGLRQQLAGAGAQDLRQGIVGRIRLTQPANVGTLAHGVSLSWRGSGRLDTRLDTPPFSNQHHPVSVIAPRQAVDTPTPSEAETTTVPSMVSPDSPGPAPSLWALLTGIGGRHRLKLALTYTLTLAENGLNVLYPYLTGVAIDALLAGRWVGVSPLLIAWTVHLAAGLFRHVYDTRVFTLVYADLAADLVERQRVQGANAAHLAARVTLSREIVDFLQVEVPTAAASVVHFVGAAAMLFVLNLWVGALALVALVPMSLFMLWFSRISLRLNAALNDRLEREVELVS